jgi:glycosyltransferase involved in cell wall biosynthesis
MLVSVIIPTYNRAHLVTEAIDSVLNQTYTNFELLVVDDYSTDNTKEVIKSYSDSRLKYLPNTRKKGAQGARNTALYAANGEWVAMLDSDDVWVEKKLEKQLSFLGSNKKNIIGVGCGFASYDFDNESVLNRRIPLKNHFNKNDLLYKNYIGGFSVFFFKREIGLAVGGFDERLTSMQDIDFYLELLSFGEIHTLKEILVYLRVNNRDKISFNYSKKVDSVKIFTEKHFQHLKGNRRLKNRAMNRFFLYHSLNGDLSALKYLHWYIFCLFVDPANFYQIFELIARNTTSRLLGSIKKFM